MARWLAVPSGGALAIMVGMVCLFVAFPGEELFDTMFHLGRVDALANHFLSGGGYPCRLYATSCSGLGYAAPLFYGDLFLIPIALLRACGASLTVCFGALFAEQIVLAFGIMYGMCAWFGLRVKERLACAAFSLFAPSTMMMIFSYGQAGMAIATAFLPCVVFPTFVLLYEDEASGRRLWEATFLLIVGMSASLLSHVITAILAGFFVGALCLFRLTFLLHEPRRLGRMAFAAFATLGLTAWFWVPMLEQRAAVDLFAISPEWRALVDKEAAGWTALQCFFIDTFVWLRGIFCWLSAHIQGEWKWTVELAWVGFDSFSAWGWFLVPLAYLLFRKGTLARFDKTPLWVRAAGWALLVLTVFAATPLTVSVLKPLLWWTQFPSRFFGLWTCLLTPLVVCFAFRRCTVRQRRLLCLAFLTMFFVICVYPLQGRSCVLMGWSPQVSEVDYDIGRGEYLPARFVLDTNETSRAIKDKNLPWGWHDIAPWGAGPYSLDVETSRASVTVPRFYYKGYAATLDGASVPLRKSSEGLVEVETAGKMGELRVWYAGTPLQRVSGWISIGTVAALLLLFFFLRSVQPTPRLR